MFGTQTYDPWGKVRSELGEDSYLGFQADPTDQDTGLVDMGARNYAPELGRFTTVDPVAGKQSNPLSVNAYLYGVADPVTSTDPTGMCADPWVCPNPPGSNKRTRKSWNRERDQAHDRQERYHEDPST